MVLASRLASHVAGVAAAGAALHLDAGRPDDEVGGGGIHLAPGDLIDGRPHLTHRWQGLLHHCRGETTQVTDCKQERAQSRSVLYAGHWHQRTLSDFKYYEELMSDDVFGHSGHLEKSSVVKNNSYLLHNENVMSLRYGAPSSIILLNFK